MRLIVHIHAHYTDSFASLLLHLARVLPEAHFVVSASAQDQFDEISSIWRGLAIRPGGTILPFPNIGRDIAPLLFRVREMFSDQDIVLHVHTKKSPHLATPATGISPGRQWFLQNINCLTYSKNYVRGLISRLLSDPKLGVLFPPPFLPVMPSPAWGANRLVAEGLLHRLALPTTVLDELPLMFPMGSMFWFRPAALSQLFGDRLSLDDFPPEPLGHDGTLAHAIERCLLHIAWSNGYRSAMVRPHGAPDLTATMGADDRQQTRSGMPDDVDLVPFP